MDYTLHPRDMGLTVSKPTQIEFAMEGTWVLRITKDGITANPDIPADAAAKAVLEALKAQLSAVGAIERSEIGESPVG